MIQRIQSLYMLLAVVCVVLGMCSPLGVFRAEDSTPMADLYNLWLSVEDVNTGSITHVILPWAALFFLLAIVASLLTVNIFLFKKRALQMRIVNFSMLILVGYHLAAIAFILLLNHRLDLPLVMGYRPTVWAAMPLVALIFCYLAFRGILKDQLLVQSLDRLR